MAAPTFGAGVVLLYHVHKPQPYEKRWLFCMPAYSFSRCSNGAARTDISQKQLANLRQLIVTDSDCTNCYLQERAAYYDGPH